jgi:Acyltransferase family/EF hand
MDKTVAAGGPVAKPRFYALDSVRAVAMLLGVVYHALLFGGGMMMMGPGGPGRGGNGGQILMEWVHSFRMALFFMISGFFSHMMLKRYGVWPYLAKRWWRLGGAMVVYLAVLFGINQLTGGRGGPFRGGPGGFGPPRGGGRPEMTGGQRGFGPGGPGGERGFGPGGPGGFGGPGGPAGRPPPDFARGGGTGGFGGPPGFGPGGGPMDFSAGGLLANGIVEAGDKNQDGTLTADELAQLGKDWFKALDTKHVGQLNPKEFSERFSSLFAPNSEGDESDDGMPRFNPLMFMGRGLAPGVFKVLDTDKDGVLREAEMSASMAKWTEDFANAKQGLTQKQLSEGLTKVLPKMQMPGPRGGPFGGTPVVGRFLFGDHAGEFGMGPMWFLWFLIVFATLGPAVAWIGGRVAGAIGWERVDGALVGMLRWGGFPLLLAGACVPILWLDGTSVGRPPDGMTAIGSTFPDVMFRYHPDWPYFMTWFMTGWLLYRLRGHLDGLGRGWPVFLAVGIGMHFYGKTFSSGGGMPFGPQEEIEPSRQFLGYLTFMLAAAGTSFGMMGLFQRHLNRPARIPRYLADTAFWIYLLHQELLTQVILPRLTPLRLPWWLQLPAALGCVLAVAFTTFELLVRRTPLTWLFGPTPSGKPKPAQGAVAAVEGR